MPLSPDTELLLLILASQGGASTRADVEAEFARVRALSPEALRAWRAAAIERLRIFAELRRGVDEP